MGSIVSVKQRARKKTIAVTAFESKIYRMPVADKVEHSVEDKEIPKVLGVHKGSRSGTGTKDENVDDEGIRKIEENKVDLNENAGSNVTCKSMQTRVDNNEGDNPTTCNAAPRGVDDNGCIHERFEAKQNGLDEVFLTDHSLDEAESRGDISQNQPQNEQQQLRKRSTENTGIVHRDNHNKLMTTKNVTEWFRAVPDSPESRSSTPMHVALGSWGDGVVGTTDHQLRHQGDVTSRGVHMGVESSVGLYSDFAYVTSVQPQTPDINKASRKSRCQGGNNNCLCKRCEDHRRKAAVIIQSILRGHQVRKELMKRRSSVIKIQRIFREKVASVGGLNVIKEDKKTEQQLRKYSTSSKPWKESPISTPVLEAKIGEKTKENFELYQDDITELKWRSQRLIEQATMGEDYEPQKILLIASNVGKPELLARVSLENVYVVVYQFSDISLNEILQNISLALDDYRQGSKAKRIAFVCQGGPGFVYLCRGKVLTTAKLAKDPDLRKFLKGLGSLMSKIDPSDAKVHIIGNNVLGSKKGVKLLEEMTETFKPNRCCVESPLELSASGVEMLEEYFDVEKYKMWKRIRHTKVLQ